MQNYKIVALCGSTSFKEQFMESGADEYSVLNGVDLVRQKVKCIYIMGGAFSLLSESEYNFGQGIEFSQTFSAYGQKMST